MVDPSSSLQKIATETWVEATWEDFLTVADNPTLVGGRFYYDGGEMRIEISPLAAARGQDHSIISTIVILFAALKNISVTELTNTSFRKIGIRECQPDLAFYVDKAVRFVSHNNTPVDLNTLDPPTLVVEIATSSWEDDIGRKRQLYERLKVREYWVVDVRGGQVMAFAISQGKSDRIQESQVLPGLAISLLEEGLKQTQTSDEGAINQWLSANLR